MNDDDTETRYLGPTANAAGGSHGGPQGAEERGRQARGSGPKQYFPPAAPAPQQQGYDYDPAYQAPADNPGYQGYQDYGQYHTTPGLTGAGNPAGGGGFGGGAGASQSSEDAPPRRGLQAGAIAAMVGAVLICSGAFYILGRATGHSEPEQVEVTTTQISTVTQTTTVTEPAPAGRGLRLPSEVPTKLPEVEVPSWLQDLIGGDQPQEPAPAGGEQHAELAPGA
ncbi:hypothetical protein ACUY3K_10990 [Corynebacterium uberis]|uniref:hypothetical protein n=1 Tax=Corynebacterium TaxID=1716 RepID=UPI001D0AA6DA|nr:MULTISPECIES: hypothetical protein [Corynebacterium]MCZ9309468.1 hypothetical protein [Corynebacterium sp. c6VSa_13]UDL73016.1 hypothetical protein LH391_07815 [Corynebacterium uberis]UDL76107.1 hypothetical protein LH393_01575 [Corynebacterium uberis]UDL78319.1 hypothetical protein LH394_01570 [Corynebacterium uberis]UDL80602.1 hypothetical protein LH392_02000 [Corynebacterium uberis]